jgi:hypothetical protein
MLYRVLGMIAWRFARRYLKQRSRRAVPGPRAGAGMGVLTAALAAGAAIARSRRGRGASG